MTKFDNIEFWGISWTKKNGRKPFQAIHDKWFYLSHILKRYTHIRAIQLLRHKSCDASRITYTGVINVEDEAFHGSDGSFNLRSLFVCQYSTLGAIATHEIEYIDNSSGKLSAYADTWLSDVPKVVAYH